MNYELAKELEDAGFQFPRKNGCANCWGDLHQRCDEDCGKEHDPNLEELIEACGDDFYELARLGIEVWQAKNLTRNIGELPKLTRGSTPTEAVAKLWLALNPVTSDSKKSV